MAWLPANRRPSRRQILGGLAAAAAAGLAYGYSSFDRARDAAIRRTKGRSKLIDTRFGPLEYAEAGTGTPILMIHGTGGGFDQGLTFGKALATRGHRIIAPSRFGYLRSSYPADPSSANQADAFVNLLDHLGIARIAVAGGSAGALSAAAFALRHPERCSALILLVPAANISEHDPVEMSRLTQWGVRRLLASDLPFWLARNATPGWLIRTLLATDPRLLDTVSAHERERAYTILDELMPISLRVCGMLNDARLAGTPAQVDFSAISVPTLLVSTEDDGFNTADTARRLHADMPGSTLRIYPTGGHIWLGHDEAIARGMANFIGSGSK